MGFKTDKKRTFLLLRYIILKSLSSGVKTINWIAKETGINWRTVELHLTYLVGKGYAREIFNSQYVRLFEMTEQGRNYLMEYNAGVVLGYNSGNMEKEVEMERIT